MSFLSINTHSPMNRELASKLGVAKEAKNAVLGTVGRFQGLDDVEGVDLVPGDDVVMVGIGNETKLPPTITDKIKQKLPEGWVEEGPEVKANGLVRSDGEGLATAAITTFSEGKQAGHQYTRLKDGSEIYHGPTADGYAVVRENTANGTLFLATSQEPMLSAFAEASRPDFSGPVAENDPALAKPKTLKEALGDIVDAGHTSGTGTYMQGVKQRAGMIGNLWGALTGKGKDS